ncbi:hypothetical protein [Paenibacillus sp. Z6-24]
MGLLTFKNGMVLAGALFLGTVFQGGTAHALQYGGDIVPALSSSVGSNGTAKASVEETGYEAWRAFDNNGTGDSYWRAPAGGMSSLSYELNQKQVVNKYTVQADTYDAADAPKKWQFAGKIGNNWLVIDEQSNQSGWAKGEKRTFEVDNDVAYSGYALFITGNNGSKWVGINELELAQFDGNTNVIPAMSAPSATPGNTGLAAGSTATASVNAESAWKVFDHSLSSDSAWTSDAQRYVDASLTYTFASPKVIKGYAIAVTSKSTAPVSWMLVGSNDGKEWEEVIHEVKSSMRWEPGQKKIYAVDNDSAYKAYKLIINRNSGPTQIVVNELELY